MLGQCSICQEIFTAQISALHCGHTFHAHCIISWLQHSKTCPQCRGKTTEKQLINQLYFDKPTGNTQGEVDDSSEDHSVVEAQLRYKVSELQCQLTAKENRNKEFEAKTKTYKDHIQDLTNEITKLKKKHNDLSGQLHALRLQNSVRNDLEKEKQKLKDELAECQKKLKIVQAYERILQASDPISTDIALQQIGTLDAKDASNIITALKRSYDENKKEKTKLMEKVRKDRAEVAALQVDNKNLMKLCSALKEEVRMANHTPYNPRLAKFVKNKHSPMGVPELSLMDDSKSSPYPNATSVCDKKEKGCPVPDNGDDTSPDIIPATPKLTSSRGRKITPAQYAESEEDALEGACYESPKLFGFRNATKMGPAKCTSTNGMGGPSLAPLPPLKAKRLNSTGASSSGAPLKKLKSATGKSLTNFFDGQEQKKKLKKEANGGFEGDAIITLD